MTSIKIPNSVTSIYSEAFSDCTNLKDVYYSGTEEQWKKIKISNENDSLSNAKIHFNSKTEGNTTKPTNTSTTTKNISVGDMNSDGKIDSKDDVLVLKSYKVDSKDAVIILKYYAATLTGFTGSIDKFNK